MKKRVQWIDTDTGEKSENSALLSEVTPVFKEIKAKEICYYYSKNLSLNTPKEAKKRESKKGFNGLGATLSREFTEILKGSNYSKESTLFALLLTWYDQYHRILPWRGVKNPYYTWISEIMLQQTQVITVIAYFKRFIQNFPTVEALAKAEEEAVLKMWQGLGYYSRARNILKTAKIVASDYNGQFPSDIKTLLTLPGIGEYTSGAISSIAYEKKAAAIDGNVKRIMARVYGIKASIASKESMQFFRETLEKLLFSRYGDFNQALMDLGAMVCKGKQPRCELCPLEMICMSCLEKTTESIPFVPKKKAKVTETYFAVLYEKQGKYFLEHRHGDVMLKNMWGVILQEQAPLYYSKKFAEVKHVFTHKIWEMTLCVVPYNQENLPSGKWIEKSEFLSFPIAKAFQKILTLLE